MACAFVINDGAVKAIVPSTSTIAKNIVLVVFLKTILFNIRTYHTYYICDRSNEYRFFRYNVVLGNQS